MTQVLCILSRATLYKKGVNTNHRGSPTVMLWTVEITKTFCLVNCQSFCKVLTLKSALVGCVLYFPWKFFIAIICWYSTTKEEEGGGRRGKGKRKRRRRSSRNLTTFNYEISSFNRDHRRLNLKLTFNEKDKERLIFCTKGTKMDLETKSPVQCTKKWE